MAFKPTKVWIEQSLFILREYIEDELKRFIRIQWNHYDLIRFKLKFFFGSFFLYIKEHILKIRNILREKVYYNQLSDIIWVYKSI